MSTMRMTLIDCYICEHKNGVFRLKNRIVCNLCLQNIGNHVGYGTLAKEDMKVVKNLTDIRRALNE